MLQKKMSVNSMKFDIVNFYNNRRFLVVNMIIFTVFFFVYRFMGMKEHFDVEPTSPNAMYFTTVTHATLGYGDIIPKTRTAKMVVTLHVLLVYTFIALATSWTFEKSEDLWNNLPEMPK